VYRDGKSHARIGVGRANEGGIDADELAAEINKRSPRISRIDGCIGLNEILVFLNSYIRAVESADDSRCHRLADPIRVADGEDEVANLQLVRIADRQRGQIFRLDPDDRNIRTGIRSDARCERLTSVGKGNDDVARASNYVIV